MNSLQKWTRPECYIGATWEGWYVFLGQNRDSDCLTRSNFQCAMERLKPLSTDLEQEEMPSVQAVRESHWACGWVEWIAIHESNTGAISEAESMAEEMEGYPVLDETHWSEMEFGEYLQAWTDSGHSYFVKELERAELIEEGALDDSTPEQTIELFEALIPSGEYQTDGTPNVRYAVDNAKRYGLPEKESEACGLVFTDDETRSNGPRKA